MMHTHTHTHTTHTNRCPISYTRIERPARGRHCRHLQCFDLGMFLEFAQKHSSWLCPCCGKPLKAQEIRVSKRSLSPFLYLRVHAHVLLPAHLPLALPLSPLPPSAPSPPFSRMRQGKVTEDTAGRRLICPSTGGCFQGC